MKQFLWLAITTFTLSACAGADEQSLDGVAHNADAPDRKGASADSAEAIETSTTSTIVHEVKRPNDVVITFAEAEDNSPLLSMTAPDGVDVSAEMKAISLTKPTLILAALDEEVPTELVEFEERHDWTDVDYSMGGQDALLNGGKVAPDPEHEHDPKHAATERSLQDHGAAWWVQNHCSPGVPPLELKLCRGYQNSQSQHAEGFVVLEQVPGNQGTWLLKVYNDHTGQLDTSIHPSIVGPNQWTWQWASGAGVGFYLKGRTDRGTDWLVPNQRPLVSVYGPQ